MPSAVADPSKTPKYAVSKLDPKDVLDQYLNGKTTPQIAAEHGISRQALNAWLRRTDLESWQSAQTALAEEEVDKAKDYRAQIQQRLETADKEERDRLTIALACARDAEKSAQWRLERVCRRIYGQDAPPAGTNAVQININLRGDKPLDVVGEQDKIGLSVVENVQSKT